MTREEKSSLTSGRNFWRTKPVERLGVPSIMLTDGPHGLRKQEVASDHLGLNKSLASTCFPTAATLANSWDLDLVERVGSALGAESAAERVSVLLGPGLNIKRNPLAGRNFEYFSEDPLVSGKLAAAMIRGIQSHGVAASPKHFAVNSQETRRMSIDEIVDERALHEMYLEGFRIAVTEGTPWTLMSSYNRVNGTYANEHHELLTEILRERWGFDGLVVTDWGGNNDRVAGLVAGNALEMPSTDGATDREILSAIEAGTLDEAVLDTRVSEYLTLLDRTAAVALGAGEVSGGSGSAPLHEAHHELAIEAARRSIVLLSNRDGALPLRPTADTGNRVAIIGDFAETPRYQGAGSSLVNPTRIDAPLDALRTALPAAGIELVGYAPGFTRRDHCSKRKLRGALALAGRADTVLLFLGLDESAEAESIDREHMRLAQNQLDLVERILELGKRVIVVLAGGAPVELPFADRVDAIVHGYLAGQGAGTALADVLTGRVNPAGKLAESYPLTYADVPSAASFTRTEATSEHRDSIYFGYRYFDKVDAPVRFPFGHGLSYTSFEYSDLVADRTAARVTITNTGARTGDEIVQLYAQAPGEAVGEFRAVRELVGFARVSLAPGEQRIVEIAYTEHAFDVYDPVRGEWATVPGEYVIQAAASSRDIRLEVPLTVSISADTDSPVPVPELRSADLPAPYLTGHVEAASASDFERLLGRPLPSPDWRRDTPLTRADIVEQTRGRGGFASLLYFVIDRSRPVLMALGKPLHANNTRFVLELPFRSVSRMSAGMVDEPMLDGLLTMVNGHFFRGARQLWSAWRAKRKQLPSSRKADRTP